MKTITKNEINFAVNNCSASIRLHLNEYTRESATQIALSTLFYRNEIPTIEKIDDLCFITWGFPISHRKGKPSKNEGGLTVKKRIDRYTYNNDMLHYDINSNQFAINPMIATMIKAITKKKVRKAFLFNLKETRVSNPLKNISVSKFKSKISDMLYMKLVSSGKLSY